jgi:hypothetical protein
MWTWIKDKWNRFQNWVASWAPGLKTKIATGLGAIGTFAAFAQQWVTGLPLDKFVSGTTIAIVSAVLFTLAFWFRGLANRDA